MIKSMFLTLGTSEILSLTPKTYIVLLNHWQMK